MEKILHGNGYIISIIPTIDEEFNPNITYNRGWTIINQLYENDVKNINSLPDDLSNNVELKVIKEIYNCEYPNKIENKIKKIT